jgi:hypothetical protein
VKRRIAFLKGSVRVLWTSRSKMMCGWEVRVSPREGGFGPQDSEIAGGCTMRWKDRSYRIQQRGSWTADREVHHLIGVWKDRTRDWL